MRQCIPGDVNNTQEAFDYIKPQNNGKIRRNV